MYHQTQYLTVRNHVYYFNRRVPLELQSKLNKKRIIISLNTKSPTKAQKLSYTISDRLERYWDNLRLDLFHSKHIGKIIIEEKNTNEKITLSMSLNNYLNLKSFGKNDLFKTSATRNISYAIQCFQDIDINKLEVKDGGVFRDYLFKKGLSSSSIKRIFSSVKSIINFNIKEYGINIHNPFSGTYIPDDNKTKIRLPIPIENIRSIQAECKSINDDNRWLIALISDTGMRLSEAAGLLTSDIILDTDIPHINLINHPWRRLKTKGSNRSIPLIGASLWAAKKVTSVNNQFAFPRYTNSEKCNANSASNGLNKWLKPRAPNGCVIHSFRHSLRDRLRAVQCPSDIADAIGGWSTSGIGQSYGSGYNLQVKHAWMNKI